MYQSIFDAAKNYDFEEIMRYVECSGKINISNSAGESLLLCFLKGYRKVAEKATETDRKAWLEHDENDLFWDEYAFAYQKTQLEERAEPIKSQLDFFSGSWSRFKLLWLFETL